MNDTRFGIGKDHIVGIYISRNIHRAERLHQDSWQPPHASTSNGEAYTLPNTNAPFALGHSSLEIAEEWHLQMPERCPGQYRRFYCEQPDGVELLNNYQSRLLIIGIYSKREQNILENNHQLHG